MSGDRIVCVDLETGGTDRFEHAITQIAAIACRADTFEPIEEFEAKLRFRPEFATEEALRLNHFDPALWAAEARDPFTVAEEFAEWLRSHSTLACVSKNGRPYRAARLMGHNPSFDVDFLLRFYRCPSAQNGIADGPSVYFPGFPLALCTMQLAQWAVYVVGTKKPPANWKLATLASWLRIDSSGAHDALADCRIAVEIARRMTARLRRDARFPDEEEAAA